MRKIIFPVLCFLSLAAAGGLLMAQAPGATPLGQIVCNFLGRLDFDAQRNAQFRSYFTALPGLDADDLFVNGENSEKAARFTIVSTPIRVEFTRVGLVIQGRIVPASGDASRHRVYYNPLPINRSFDRPDSFADGELIATFRAHETMVSAIPLLPASAVSVLELESSKSIVLAGRSINLAQFSPAIRAHFFGGPTPAARSDAPSLSFPVSGYAVAVTPSPRAQ
ncbi:MAG: hypothetical protein U0Q16_14825 [Bryobacteraceae bacterium]